MRRRSALQASPATGAAGRAHGAVAPCRRSERALDTGTTCVETCDRYVSSACRHVRLLRTRQRARAAHQPADTTYDVRELYKLHDALCATLGAAQGEREDAAREGHVAKEPRAPYVLWITMTRRIYTDTVSVRYVLDGLYGWWRTHRGMGRCITRVWGLGRHIRDAESR
jgi:hypothetical protein